MSADRRDPSRPDRRLVLPRAGGRRATDPPAEWISVTVFAAKYGIDRNTVHKWLRDDVLLFYRVGTVIRIRDLPPNDHSALKAAETVKLPLPLA